VRPSAHAHARRPGDGPARRRLSWRGHTVALEVLGGEVRETARPGHPGHPHHPHRPTRDALPSDWAGYGYLEGLLAQDGDSLDILVGPGGVDGDEPVYLAGQLAPPHRRLAADDDIYQYKLLVGFEDEEAATNGFLRMWPPGMFGGVEDITDSVDAVIDALVASGRERTAANEAGRGAPKLPSWRDILTIGALGTGVAGAGAGMTPTPTPTPTSRAEVELAAATPTTPPTAAPPAAAPPTPPAATSAAPPTPPTTAVVPGRLRAGYEPAEGWPEGPDPYGIEARPVLPKPEGMSGAMYAALLRAERYRELVRAAARAHDVDPAMLDAVLWVESKYNPSAVSATGAVGIGQFTRATARDVGLSLADRQDPVKGAFAAARYLALCVRKARGDVYRSFAGYNFGPYGLAQASRGHVPWKRETQKYVERATRRLAESPLRGPESPKVPVYEALPLTRQQEQDWFRSYNQRRRGGMRRTMKDTKNTRGTRGTRVTRGPHAAHAVSGLTREGAALAPYPDGVRTFDKQWIVVVPVPSDVASAYSAHGGHFTLAYLDGMPADRPYARLLRALEVLGRETPAFEVSLDGRPHRLTTDLPERPSDEREGTTVDLLDSEVAPGRMPIINRVTDDLLRVIRPHSDGGLELMDELGARAKKVFEQFGFRLRPFRYVTHSTINLEEYDAARVEGQEFPVSRIEVWLNGPEAFVDLRTGDVTNVSLPIEAERANPLREPHEVDPEFERKARRRSRDRGRDILDAVLVSREAAEGQRVATYHVGSRGIAELRVLPVELAFGVRIGRVEVHEKEGTGFRTGAVLAAAAESLRGLVARWGAVLLATAEPRLVGQAMRQQHEVVYAPGGVLVGDLSELRGRVGAAATQRFRRIAEMLPGQARGRVDRLREALLRGEFSLARELCGLLKGQAGPAARALSRFAAELGGLEGLAARTIVAMRPGVEEVRWEQGRWLDSKTVQWSGVSAAPTPTPTPNPGAGAGAGAEPDLHIVSVSPLRVLYERLTMPDVRVDVSEKAETASMDAGLEYAARHYGVPPPPPKFLNNQPSAAPKKPSPLSSREKDRILRRVYSERVTPGVGSSTVGADWKSVLFIGPDGSLVLSETEGGVRGEDHRCIGAYLPPRFSELTGTEKMNLVMRATGLARLLYMGGDYALVDIEKPLTEMQRRVLQDFRRSTGVRELEHSGPGDSGAPRTAAMHDRHDRHDRHWTVDAPKVGVDVDGRRVLCAVAETPEQHVAGAQGLVMGPNQGLLFRYGEARPLSFWMPASCPQSLDVHFLRDGQVVKTLRDCRPGQVERMSAIADTVVEVPSLGRHLAAGFTVTPAEPAVTQAPPERLREPEAELVVEPEGGEMPSVPTNPVPGTGAAARGYQSRAARWVEALRGGQGGAPTATWTPQGVWSHPGVAALQVARRALGRFRWPSKLELKLGRFHRHGAGTSDSMHDAQDGLIEVEARVELGRRTGHFTVPIRLMGGKLLDPGVFQSYGQSYLLTESAVEAWQRSHPMQEWPTRPAPWYQLPER
jgi:soluble lytic murein transglycosylase-like protein/uncharacterized membrane protein (UPF0127 family)